jgi:hypothetical protein
MKNTVVLGLGFNPNRHKEENKQEKTKQPTNPALVQHKEDSGDAG